MHPVKEYAMLCELATQSTNGLNSYVHIFDRTSYPQGQPIALRGFLAVRFTRLPAEGNLEVYVTDANNTLIEKGTMFKQGVKGPNANLIVRIAGMNLPAAGEYRIWARLDAGEPIELCAWHADVKVKGD
ncbi:MAG: hypothetical protein NUV56_03870 [Candidatus Uhrbacteria bacterium]|nr:hypothetical protein [Candidatus Uhrbacteria bacterium]